MCYIKCFGLSYFLGGEGEEGSLSELPGMQLHLSSVYAYVNSGFRPSSEGVKT